MAKITGQSPRHVWHWYAQNADRCDRCGRFFHRLTDGLHGPFYCYPMPEWLTAHPDDNRKDR